jgi:hypothetical protein
MFTEDSFGFSVTCNVSGVFAWFWQFLVGRLYVDHLDESGVRKDIRDSVIFTVEATDTVELSA